jgi:hypothetical protein
VKVLEKVLINRINHYVYLNDYMNNNQYVFSPRRSTIEAAMVLKDFVEEGLNSGDGLVIVSLDIKGTFDAAWWPRILKS